MYTPKYAELSTDAIQKLWNYHIDLDNKNAATSYKIAFQELAKYTKYAWINHISKFDHKHFKDQELKRRFHFLSILGDSALDENKFAEFMNITSSMNTVFQTAKVCHFNKRECDVETEGVPLIPDLSHIMSQPTKHSYEELSYVWEGWRNATGRIMRKSYEKYVSLCNDAAVANNFKDASELWLAGYKTDDPDFQSELESIWQQLAPFYQKIHGYVRHKLRQYWGNERIDAKHPIPAHIVGDMWGQSWESLLPILLPFENASDPLAKVNDALKSQQYDVRRIFDLSNSFYTNLGFEDMKMSYVTNCSLRQTKENKECFKHSPMIERPEWDVMCGSSAWPIDYSKCDFRIKMCAGVNLRALLVIHHEMGHIQCYIHWENLPAEFRNAANPGFDEAIGDTMALSVQTPRHLMSVGLLEEAIPSFESDINYLLKIALSKITILSFAYTVDQYRWSVFDGTIKTNELNSKWWQLRERYQGIVPPVRRSERDMDACAKYHVASHVPYIRYFVAHILQFEFYRQMCITAEQYTSQVKNEPLHRCDFSFGNSTRVAARKMIQLIKAGASRPWPDVLEEMTGSRKMDASAILEYFSPLEEWLDIVIERDNISLGWISTYQQKFTHK